MVKIIDQNSSGVLLNQKSTINYENNSKSKTKFCRKVSVGNEWSSAIMSSKSIFLVGVCLLIFGIILPCDAINPISTLQCHRRQYTYKVQQRDSLGRRCWGVINVMSCWGRCDSNEVCSIFSFYFYF